MERFLFRVGLGLELVLYCKCIDGNGAVRMNLTFSPLVKDWSGSLVVV